MRVNLQMLAAMSGADLRQIKERDFSIAVREYAESQGWLVEYRFRSANKLSDGTWRGTGPKGFPDLFMVRSVSAVAAELKTESGSTSPEQRAWLSALSETCVESYLWRPRDAREIIKELRDGKATE